MGDFLIRDANIQIGLNGYVTIRIYSDGTVENAYTEKQLGRGVWMPPHGRLIDADVLIDCLVGTHDGRYEPAHTNVAIDDERIVEEQATVIPASE